MIHEIHRQPIQQLGMRRRVALRAQVLGRHHQADAEVRLPERDSPASARSSASGDRRASGRTRADSRGSSSRERMQERRHARLHFLRRREEIAAIESMRLPRHLAFADDQLRCAVRMLLPERFDLRVRFLPLRHRRPPIAEHGAACSGVRSAAGTASASRTAAGNGSASAFSADVTEKRNRPRF